MLELEKTYLAKNFPKDLKTCEFKEIIDVYLPKESKHPELRLRKNGDRYEFTKKTPINENDRSEQEEENIILSEVEFNALNEQLDGKRLRKLRYFYDYEGRTAEIAIFQDDLEGLVTVEFEFENKKDLEKFQMPDFCLVDVTQELFIAGGMLCGKQYRDVESDLKRFGYKKLSF